MSIRRKAAKRFNPRETFREAGRLLVLPKNQIAGAQKDLETRRAKFDELRRRSSTLKRGGLAQRSL
jgi:hypothetical protein